MPLRRPFGPALPCLGSAGGTSAEVRMTNMNSSRGDRKHRPTRAGRRELRRALADGRPITDPYLRSYALKRVSKLDKFFQRQLKISPGQMRFRALGVMLFGIAVIIHGATRSDGPEIAAGIWLASMGLAYILFHRVIRRRIRHLHDRVSRMKRTYSNDAGND